MTPRSSRIMLVLAAFAGGLVLFLGAILVVAGRGPGGTAAAAIGGPFTLTDQNGRTRSDRDFRGKLMIVYFGDTFCPDICPADLMAITQALDALGPAADDIQPIFITIDPERDTKVLAEFIKAFHKNFVGLTGSPQEIRKVANAYKAFYARLPPAADGEYAFDHTGVIYLMGRDGKYLGFMPPQTGPEKLTEILRKYLAK